MEANRVLRVGGSLLVFVPDMRKLAYQWGMGKINDYLYMVNVYGAYMGDEVDRHKWGYTEASLRKLIEANGEWKSVELFDGRKIDGADIAKDWWILGMEAVKTSATVAADAPDMIVHMPLLEEKAKKCNGFVLELGCLHGTGSTRAFRRGLKKNGGERLMVTVDMDPLMPDLDVPWEEWWHKVLGRTEDERTFEAVEKLCKGREAGVIFIDTDHTYEQMQKELELWKGLAGPDTVWLFHDTFMFGGYNPMTNAIKEFAVREGLMFEEVTRESHGMGLMRRRGL
jgi:hypothetical protein